MSAAGCHCFNFQGSAHFGLLKTLAKGVSESYSVTVNDSFLTGVYPTNLKIAKVVALHKKGPSDNPTNYRPIKVYLNHTQ